MRWQVSDNDRQFAAAVQDCSISLDEFDHRAHLKLAYVYLTMHTPDEAVDLVRGALMGLLEHNNIDTTKYHETITRAWVLAVFHFMNKSVASVSADTFIDQHPQMLNAKIMMSHYSPETLFSEDARLSFLEPDLSPIPQYA